ncbi:Pathogenesis-related protein 1C [Hordeum vulgare]|uniref:SCP domain-containing protein n=1 Tax=Hordeum vulgare subsp. vulgare TaxID=112509 RepID=A0A8I6WWB5_HORVV|nr:pathogenesis-related protein 1-like [Hordeum vulgare subsp. vulgare]KAE8785075.1 Pathogenesis-related protein 1C [Hordeum vulgare]KAI5013966.1 hypothetical protein ZWY2020_055356 [Hordeum vulgare]
MFPFACVATLTFALASLPPAAALIVPGHHNPGAAVVPSWTQFLRAHNDARSAVGLPPVTWNWTLELDAMQYANKLRVPCKLSPMRWTTDGVYGRNLYWASGHHSAAHAVAAWVGERRWYDHRANACAPGKTTCGEYTQVVWNTTRELGCGRRTCQNGLDTVAVCDYFPPGNYVGVLPY